MHYASPKARKRALRQRIRRLLGDLDAVAADHHAEQLAVSRLLEPLQRNRVAQGRVGNLRRKGINDASGAQLRVQHFLPKRHRPQTRRRRIIEFRPGQVFGFERRIALDEQPAKQLFMRVRADLHDAIRSVTRKDRRPTGHR